MVVMVIGVVRINRKSREWKRSFFLGIASIDVNNGSLRFRIFEEIHRGWKGDSVLFVRIFSDIYIFGWFYILAHFSNYGIVSVARYMVFISFVTNVSCNWNNSVGVGLMGH